MSSDEVAQQVRDHPKPHIRVQAGEAQPREINDLIRAVDDLCCALGKTCTITVEHEAA